MSHSPPIRGKLTIGIIPTTYQAPTSDKCLSATPDVGAPEYAFAGEHSHA